jgi:putative phosphoesterase
MKIGVLSDIHGNKFALEQVLIEARRENLTKLLVLGDIVGYYYYPDKALDLLSDWDFLMIKGNHEEILFDIIDGFESNKKIKKKYGSGHECAIEKLNKNQLNLLRSLPESKVLSFDGVSILMTHGSPWSKNLYVYPDANLEVVQKFDNYNYDFILFGHTHYACSFKTTNGWALNPGSVGQSRQNGGKAYWAIIDTANKSFQMKTTDYSTEKLLNEVLEKDSKVEYLSNILNR